jgi:hypothetical protein
VLPTYYPDLERLVQDNLARCKLSIHMIGSHYGVIPEEAEKSLLALQYELAVTHCRERPELSRLVWLPMGLQTQDARQQGLIQAIQEDSDWLQTGLEELKTVIQDRLTAPPARLADEATATEARRVYLICDDKDLEAIGPLYDNLFDGGYEVILPAFEGDEADVRQVHQANLCDCDAVLIYYGSGSDLWQEAKLRDLQKAAGYGRTKPMLAKAIYVAAPETPKKKLVRTREAIAIKNFAAFEPEDLAPFLSQMDRGGQAK